MKWLMTNPRNLLAWDSLITSTSTIISPLETLTKMSSMSTIVPIRSQAKKERSPLDLPRNPPKFPTENLKICLKSNLTTKLKLLKKPGELLKDTKIKLLLSLMKCLMNLVLVKNNKPL